MKVIELYKIPGISQSNRILYNELKFTYRINIKDIMKVCDNYILVDDEYLEICKDLLNSADIYGNGNKNKDEMNSNYISMCGYKYDGYILTFDEFVAFIDVTNELSFIIRNAFIKLTYNEWIIKRLLE